MIVLQRLKLQVDANLCYCFPLTSRSFDRPPDKRAEALSESSYCGGKLARHHDSEIILTQGEGGNKVVDFLLAKYLNLI